MGEEVMEIPDALWTQYTEYPCQISCTITREDL